MNTTTRQSGVAAPANHGGEAPALFLMGPTASGKTDLAVALARRLPVEIVSVDSVMVYRGLDIGTAKPDAETLAEAPHRLIDIADPAEVYSAARFREDALREVSAIRARGRIPLLVGGTMLYYRALEYGLSPLPGADPEVRAWLEREAREHGWAALHERLSRVDPEAAARIHPNDPQRIQRALEIHELTGKTPSGLWAEPAQDVFPYGTLKWVLAPPRAVLRQRIADRFHAMLAQGLVAEVDALYQRGDLTEDLPAVRAVGYRQVWDYLAGNIDHDQMVQKGIVASCQLAKRQMTWLRRERQAGWLEQVDSHAVEAITRRVEALVA